MFEHVKLIKIPVMCQGKIVEPSTDEKDVGLVVVNVDTDIGNIPRLRTKLCFAPGTDTNFVVGDAVMVMVELYYSLHQEKYVDIAHDGRHIVMGKHHPFSMKPDIPVKNVNANVAGGSYRFLNPRNHCGVVVEDNGAIDIVTNGLVNKRMSPGGAGADEESETTNAQNFHRVIMNQEAGHRAREYFGMFRGKDTNAMITNAADVSGKKMFIAYKRFVPKSMNPNFWVSTCEGAYAPWIGPNNEVDKVMDSDDILFSKVIHALDSRITVTGGKKGPSFFSIRIDKVTPMSEKMPGSGPDCTPPASFLKAAINMNEDGELVAEFGVDASLNAAATVKITKDGSVEVVASKGLKFTTKTLEMTTEIFSVKSPKIKLDGAVEVTGSLKSGGKNLATKDSVSDLVSVITNPASWTPAAIAAPPTMLPTATTQFNLGLSTPGKWLTNPADTAVAEPVVAVAATPSLKST